MPRALGVFAASSRGNGCGKVLPASEDIQDVAPCSCMPTGSSPREVAAGPIPQITADVNELLATATPTLPLLPIWEASLPELISGRSARSCPAIGPAFSLLSSSVMAGWRMACPGLTRVPPAVPRASTSTASECFELRPLRGRFSPRDAQAELWVAGQAVDDAGHGGADSGLNPLPSIADALASGCRRPISQEFTTVTRSILPAEACSRPQFLPVEGAARPLHAAPLERVHDQLAQYPRASK